MISRAWLWSLWPCKCTGERPGVIVDEIQQHETFLINLISHPLPYIPLVISERPLWLPASGETIDQSFTPPFQSAILPSLIPTNTTLTSSPSMKQLAPPSPSLAPAFWVAPKNPCSSRAWSPNVLFSKCFSLHHLSSSLPCSIIRAWPFIVALILLNALVLILSSKLAKLDLVACGGGEPSRVGSGARVGGRWDTQSCTSNETRGLLIRFRVFFDEGLVVIMITGVGSKGVEGR